jgi:hypothetical protein
MSNINRYMYTDTHAHTQTWCNIIPYAYSFYLLCNTREVSWKYNSIMNTSSEQLIFYTFILYDTACPEKC